jgi:hypothetical protein
VEVFLYHLQHLRIPAYLVHLSLNAACPHTHGLASCQPARDIMKEILLTRVALLTVAMAQHHYNHTLFNCKDAEYPERAGDGRCDSPNNIADCWDGGDCCYWSCEANCNQANPCSYECSYNYPCGM